MRLAQTAAIMMCSLSRSCAALEVGAAAGLSTHMGGRSVGSKKKVRHHVNPLKAHHMKTVELPEQWAESCFAQPAAPLHVDIGCARGVFCLELAQKAPHLNVLGLEIRQILADAATADAKALALGNVAFVGCNANVNLRPILERAGPTCTMSSASIQFPDPWRVPLPRALDPCRFIPRSARFDDVFAVLVRCLAGSRSGMPSDVWFNPSW